MNHAGLGTSAARGICRWQPHVLERIEAEVLRGRDEGTVRAIEAGGEEERPVAMLFEQRNRLAGHLAVGVRLVWRRRRVVSQRAAEALTLRREVGQHRLLVLVDAAGVHRVIPRGRIVEPRRPYLPWIAVVVDLPDTRRHVARPLEHLRQRDEVRVDGAEIGLQIMDARRVRAQARQHRHAARAAERELRVGPCEADAARRESIEVRRPDNGMAERPQVVAEVVGHDEQDVRAPCDGLRGRHASADERTGNPRQRGQSGWDGSWQVLAQRPLGCCLLR